MVNNWFWTHDTWQLYALLAVKLVGLLFSRIQLGVSLSRSLLLIGWVIVTVPGPLLIGCCKS